MDLFRKHEHSGLSAAQFCRENKLCTRYFSKRKQQLNWPAKKLKRPTKPKKLVNDFIKVSVSEAKVSLSLECGSLKLRWDELPPSDWLSELVNTIK